MKRLFYTIFLISALFVSCSDKEKEEKPVELTPEEIRQQQIKDSLALRVGVMPTMDCLPFYVAEAEGFYKEANVDVRLKQFTAQMDCDTALVGGSVTACISDIIRCERLTKQGTTLELYSPTLAQWTLQTTRQARIKDIKQLSDKTIGMTRFSATHRLSEMVLDSAKLNLDKVFLIQINNVKIRYRMMMQKQLDAAWTQEPWTTMLSTQGCRSILTSDKYKQELGCVAIRLADTKKDKRKAEQIKQLVTSYNRAVDSINSKGVSHYAHVLSNYCEIPKAYADTVANHATRKFVHIKTSTKEQ